MVKWNGWSGFCQGRRSRLYTLDKKKRVSRRMQPSETTELTKMNKNTPLIIGLGIVTRKGENSKCGQECFNVPGYIEEVEFLELKQGRMPQSEA